MRTDHLQEELDATRRRLQELTDEVARNENKMRRSQQRELRLLQADDMASLFHEIVEGLRASYGLQTVSPVEIEAAAEELTCVSTD